MPSEIQPPFKVKLDNGKVLHSFLSIGYGFTSDCDIESEYLRFLVSSFSSNSKKVFCHFLGMSCYFCKAQPTINPTHFKIIFNYSVQERKEENIFLRISILYPSQCFFSVSFKGQLISKCLFGVFNFFQKTKENTFVRFKNSRLDNFFQN